MRPLLALAALTLLVSIPTAARAQAVDDTRARADALFREGQSLVSAGQVAVGCQRLEESQRMDPKLGRLLNVAYCHELLGRTATAWSEYNEGAALALQTKQPERASFARARAASLAQQLSFLRFDLSAAPEVSEIKVDGTALGRDRWAVPFPIDPGTHALTFGGAGRQPHEKSVLVEKAGTLRVVVEPLLPEASPAPQPQSAAPPAPAAPPPTPASQSAVAPRDTPPPESPSGSRTLGWIVGGIGVAALGVGAGFGVYAMALRDQANPQCPNKLCTPHGKSLIDDASTAAIVSDIGLAVGVAGVGAGAWLLLRPLPAGGASVALQGAW